MKYILLLILLSSWINAVSITTRKQSYTVKENIIVNLSSMPGGGKDWIGVYPVGSSTAWENVVSWKWTQGARNGTISLPKISKTGRYEARAFYRNSYHVEATSNIFEVTPSNNKPLKIIPFHNHSYTEVNNFSFKVENMGGNNNDWIALYPIKANNDWSNVVLWRWVKNMENGTLTFSRNGKTIKVGEYQIRGFFNNSFKVEGVSEPIFITSYKSKIKLSTSKKKYFLNETLVVKFENISTDKNNWIGIYKKDKETLAENNLAWQWTGDRQKGQLTFENLPIGKYDVRVFFNNSYTPQKVIPFEMTDFDFQEENFPIELLNGEKNPTRGIQIIYSKDKKRAYAFIDATKTTLYIGKYNGIVTIDNSDKNNPKIIDYLQDQTWEKDTPYLTENNNFLVFIDKEKDIFSTIKVLNVNKHLKESSNFHIENRVSTLLKADNLNLFYTKRRWAERPIHRYYHINNNGLVITRINNIPTGAMDRSYIIDQGTLNNNRYYITYYTDTREEVNRWEKHKRIYDVSNLPTVTLIDIIISKD